VFGVAATAAVLAVLRIRAGAVRHAAWAAATCAMLAMPLLQRVAPPIAVALPGASIAGLDAIDMTGSTGVEPIDSAAPATDAGPVGRTAGSSPVVRAAAARAHAGPRPSSLLISPASHRWCFGARRAG
jgi:hypothetical protein